MIWAAGVRATALTERLGAPIDRAGRVLVNRDLTVPGHHNVFAIGDMTYLEQDGKPLPGVSPVAMQMAVASPEIFETIWPANPMKISILRQRNMATIGARPR